MELRYFENKHLMSLWAHHWLEKKIAQYQAHSLYLPAGSTPQTLYHLWEEGVPKGFSQLRLLQVDEVITGPRKGLFAQFFREHLPTWASKVESPAVSDGAIADLTILGLGLNGHVAFHEPKTPLDFVYGEMDLEASTRENLGLSPQDRALSYGVGAFVKSKAILLMVMGEGKEEVFHDFLNRSSGLPVHGLKEHSDLTVIAMEAFR
ncbi:MAG: 6-phosphogluconolactonase [Bdellovibrionales bacterium]|nr:6-phosphogluconolactonase [Bdellovibrionales bacterium]